ncbi:MAG: serine hydroxymethyltransferase [Deltaproteobacteria bacterium]|nr:serine hydroxymethyltransferase [Deltaproteobacteria bacterium]
MVRNAGSLAEVDPDIAELVRKETERKELSIELIPSENATSRAVMEVCGSVLTDKYCEGYPGKRYYGGCQYYDEIEKLAIDRAKEMFGAEEVNVQPHSGASANLAVLFGLLNPGDTILGPRLDHGGHLTHGSPVNFSGKYFNVVAYGVNLDSHLIEEHEVRKLAEFHKPKVIISGMTAYSRQIDFEMFGRVAKEVGAYHFSDVSHYAGLIVGGVYDNPVPHADIVTTTTHKTLRGPRGGMIMGRGDLMKKMNKAVFPGFQGGPLMHQVAGKAVAFKEALTDEFRIYASRVVTNARELAEALQDQGFKLLTGGTDSHVMVVDLRGTETTGADAETALGKVGITVNKNTVPGDPRPPAITSGIRLGSPTVTTRGFRTEEMDRIAEFMRAAIDAAGDEAKLANIREKVVALCRNFPLYDHGPGRAHR